MSVKVMTRVWDKSEAKGSALLTLIALADWSNDDGISWPSIDKLHKKTRLTRRQQQRLMDYLSNTPELYIEKGTGRNGTNRYFVLTGLTKDEIIEIFCEHLDMSVEDAELLALSIINRDRGVKITRVTSTSPNTSSNTIDSSLRSESISAKADLSIAKTKPKRTRKKKTEGAEPKADPSPRPRDFIWEAVFTDFLDGVLGDKQSQKAHGGMAGKIKGYILEVIPDITGDETKSFIAFLLQRSTKDLRDPDKFKDYAGQFLPVLRQIRTGVIPPRPVMSQPRVSAFTPPVRTSLDDLRDRYERGADGQLYLKGTVHP